MRQLDQALLNKLCPHDIIVTPEPSPSGFTFCCASDATLNRQRTIASVVADAQSLVGLGAFCSTW